MYKFEADLVCCWSAGNWSIEQVKFELDFDDPTDAWVLDCAEANFEGKDNLGDPPQFFALSGFSLGEDES